MSKFNAFHWKMPHAKNRQLLDNFLGQFCPKNFSAWLNFGVVYKKKGVKFATTKNCRHFGVFETFRKKHSEDFFFQFAKMLQKNDIVLHRTIFHPWKINFARLWQILEKKNYIRRVKIWRYFGVFENLWKTVSSFWSKVENCRAYRISPVRPCVRASRHISKNRSKDFYEIWYEGGGKKYKNLHTAAFLKNKFH